MDNNIWKNYIYKYVCENNLVDFYTKFLKAFETKWSEFLSSYDFDMLCQLNNGNRLRPMLVFWGYLLNRSDNNLFDISESDLNFILHHCIAIESIHKMSLLVDDWIDEDVARHGETTFHVIHGAESTILLAMNILMRGFLEISCIEDRNKQNTLPLALQISYDMTLGALKEISSSNSILNITNIKDIISLETSSIIRNSIVIGYTAGLGDNNEIVNLLDDIGYCCGFIFQTLNDMEPFGNMEALIQHKGTLTTDILKNRKNIVVAYIYTFGGQKELEKISYMDNADILSNYIVTLIGKYGIKEHLLNEISRLQLQIQNSIEKIEKITNHVRWCKHFKEFIDITIAASKKRALC